MQDVAEKNQKEVLANRGGSELRAQWMRRLVELEFIPPAEGPRL